MTDPPDTRPPLHVSSVVLVVDDAPDTLRMLCDALAIEGYTVLVARDAHRGAGALRDGRARRRAARRRHARRGRLRAVPPPQGRALLGPRAGDLHDRPVRDRADRRRLCQRRRGLRGQAAAIPEVLARLATHLRNAHVSRLAREAVDVAGLGVVLLDSQGRVAWRSPQAMRWLEAGARAAGRRGASAALAAGRRARRARR